MSKADSVECRPDASAPRSVMTVKELAIELRVSDDVIYRHVNSADPGDHWPHRRVGRRIFFWPADFAAIEAKTRAVPPVTPSFPVLPPGLDPRMVKGLRRLRGEYRRPRRPSEAV